MSLNKVIQHSIDFILYAFLFNIVENSMIPIFLEKSEDIEIAS